MRKAVVMNTPKMRQIAVNVDGTAATPEASGHDKSQVSSVVDNGTGSWTIILKKPFNKENPNKPMAQVTSLTAGAILHVSATDFDRVTVQAQDDAGSAMDADFTVSILGCDHRLPY